MTEHRRTRGLGPKMPATNEVQKTHSRPPSLRRTETRLREAARAVGRHAQTACIDANIE